MNTIPRTLTLIVSVCAASKLTASIVYWDPADGGDGHYYEPVPASAGLTWASANTTAQSAGGYLVSISSAAENSFVFSLVDSPTYWVSDNINNNAYGPWLGLYQTDKLDEPAGHFAWTSSEPLSYTNWHPGQPDNFGGLEDVAAFASLGDPNARSPLWNDLQAGQALGYIIEFNSNPVPESAAFSLAGGAALLAFALTRRFGGRPTRKPTL